MQLQYWLIHSYNTIYIYTILASSGPYGPLLASSGYLGQILAGKFKMEFLPTLRLTKAFPCRECLCEPNCWQELHFEFSRQNLNRNVQSPSMWWWLITQPRPIWKKAPPGLQRHFWSDAQVRGSCIDPTHLSHTLNLILKAPGARCLRTIQLLIKDFTAKFWIADISCPWNPLSYNQSPSHRIKSTFLRAEFLTITYGPSEECQGS